MNTPVEVLSFVGIYIFISTPYHYFWFRVSDDINPFFSFVLHFIGNVPLIFLSIKLSKLLYKYL